MTGWFWVYGALGAALTLAVDSGAATDPAAGIPITPSRPCPSLRSFDDEMIAFMRARSIPGGALAVSRNGKMVLASGYGWADREAGEKVGPGSLFRIASVSKPITAVAVLHLLQDSPQCVTLDTPVFDALHYEPRLAPGAQADPRLDRITIRQVLQHTAGWDPDKSFDPMFRPLAIAQAMGDAPPAGPSAIVPYILGLPLDHDPGSTYAYSNFGYCVLGRLIERLSGRPYEQYVREEVLAPLGIRDMRIGRTPAELRAPGEVRYHDPGTGENVMTPEADQAPACYGTFYLEAMDAHGGWIASAADLVRFACAFDDPNRCPLLSPQMVAAMFARPEGSAGYEPDGKPKAAYYGCGWLVRPTGDGKANHWHNGSLPGTSTLLVRRHDGLNWAALFNQRTDPSGLSYGDIDPALHRAADVVKEWPEWDLFHEESTP
jgi:N-acyl-D-amino-acid deacylase